MTKLTLCMKCSNWVPKTHQQITPITNNKHLICLYGIYIYIHTLSSRINEKQDVHCNTSKMNPQVATFIPS